jgi:general secretion pathway protein I
VPRAALLPYAARARARAFSLLEVLFAVALFGAIVTFILSAEAGLMAGNKSAENMSQATELGRCRMTELEEKELRLGYPEVEEKDTSSVCCGDSETPGFSCDWRIERVTLPDATMLAGDGGLSSLYGGNLGSAEGGAPAPTALASPAGSVLINPAGGAGLDFDGGLGNFGQSVQQSLGGGLGVQGLLSMVFSIVYPSLKPLLESAIRKITVIVRWKEGTLARDFTLTQYVTNPSRAGLISGMANSGTFGDGGAPSLGSLLQNLGGGVGGGAGGTPNLGIPGLGR